MGIKTYSKARDGAVKLSEHFTVGEFACRDGTDAVPVSEELVTLLQKIRDHFGRAVTVNSAYRTAAYNTKVGGAKRSQHLLGTAADITLAGVAPLEVAQYAEFLQPKAGGIGVYRTFTHVDVRAARSRWDSRSGKETVVSGWPGYTEAVPPTEAERAVEWITAQGILRGNVDGDRMLDEPLTRRQFAVMLYRFAKPDGRA
ncbi:D-Ala-D-Ala carboxypeptidase family metallohydrolase [uncultured Oscillibacter sp.]|uniref:D-Ala-D-Ala carboxypeptidase family metallohydrolase n=2 Tax=uncultured Oscillibacter sp. TaxID=876091 RepID=UPI00280471D9|nr:D-Ala-D-Ala carboxypeptidase family metallohydrolase [uncultured Oscillibacter sp.]